MLAYQCAVPPDTTVADLVVVLGAVVFVVAAVEATADEESSEELPAAVSWSEVIDDVEWLPDVDAVELTAEAVVPGICLETTRPRTAAAAVARIATALEVRRTLVVAVSRRLAPSCQGRPGGRAEGRVEGS